MPNAASGSGVLLALGRELEFGIPGTSGLLGHRAILPVKADLTGSESPSSAVNNSGLIEPSVPGRKGGKFELPLPLRVADLLEPVEHILRSSVKTTLEAGVYRYRSTPSINGVDTSFYSLWSKRPVEAWWLYGVKFAGMTLEIGDNAEIPVKLAGEISHGTRLGLAVGDVGNTGTYTLGPVIRGPVKDRTAGNIFVKVTRIVGGLQYKVQQVAAAPTFAGAAVDVALDPTTGRAIYQNLQGATGLDLGIWDENKDPLEIAWPGLASDHATLAVGDVYMFPITWSDPAITFLTGHQAFTSAHWDVRLRLVGDSSYLVKPVKTGTISFEWPITADTGATSRYPYAIYRDGLFTPSVELNRNLADDFFLNAAERRKRIDAVFTFAGRQLGTGVYREGITITLPQLRIDDDTRDPANEKIVAEKVKLTGEHPDSGDAACTIDIVTTRNFTPAT
jgi:hypothetical protein